MLKNGPNMPSNQEFAVYEDSDGFCLDFGDRERVEYPLTVPFANLKERAIHWLWEGRIPIGMVLLIEGAENVGKSFVALAVAAKCLARQTFAEKKENKISR